MGMNCYHYCDNADGGTALFSVCAKSITAADKLFEQAIGKSPAKLPGVGCQITPILSGYKLNEPGTPLS